ncbi:MAG: phosphotransferase family protein [Candidatus Limnocylindria bacterium]
MQPVKIAEGREAEILDWGEGRVLRLFRDPAAGARADREMGALAAVRSVLPIVPEPFERIEWQGRPGIVMQRVDGRDALTQIGRQPWRVAQLAALSGRIHAGLNEIRAPDSLPALRGELAARIAADAAIPERLRAAALEALADLPDGTALCHGDFQIANVLLSPSGPVVIDWGYATRGDPAGDFARSLLMTRLGSLPPGTPSLIRWGRRLGLGWFRQAYQRAYRQGQPHDPGRVLRWELVRAVERLADRIPEERAGLLREANRLRDQLAAAHRPA